MTPGREADGGGDDEDDGDGRRGRGQEDLLRGVRRHDDPHLLKHSGRSKGCQKIAFLLSPNLRMLPNYNQVRCVTDALKGKNV